MKKSIMMITLAFLVCAAPVYAVQKQKAVTTSLFSLMLGNINAEGNYALNDSASITAGLGFASYDSSGWDYTLLNINAGLRYYWTGSAINGWYLGPTLGLTTVSAEYEDILGNKGDTSASAVNYGGLVGYQSIWDSGFTLDLAIGATMLSIPSVDVTINGTTWSGGDISVTLPVIKLALGYAF